MQLAQCGDQCGTGCVAAACLSLGGAGLAVWQADASLPGTAQRQFARSL